MTKGITGHENEVRQWVAILVPGTKALWFQLHRDAASDQRRNINLDKVLKILDQDFANVEKAQADADKTNWPSDVKDSDLYLAALKRAQIAIFETAVAYWAYVQGVDGNPSRVLVELTKALGSAQTGSGKKHAWLAPVRVTQNSRELLELEIHARLIALAFLVEDSVPRLRELYDAAEIEGLKRVQARRIVDDYRRGKRSDPTLITLVQYWKVKFIEPVAARQPLKSLLSDPYN